MEGRRLGTSGRPGSRNTPHCESPSEPDRRLQSSPVCPTNTEPQQTVESIHCVYRREWTDTVGLRWGGTCVDLGDADRRPRPGPVRLHEVSLVGRQQVILHRFYKEIFTGVVVLYQSFFLHDLKQGNISVGDKGEAVKQEEMLTKFDVSI